MLGTQHLLGWRAIGYVEWDAYCQEVIKARIQDGVLHDAPIFGDIREFIASGCAEAYQGMVDVVTAGFPCQHFSTAHRGRATAVNYWNETRRVLEIIRPRYTFIENVVGIKTFLPTLRDDLLELGYCVHIPLRMGAASVGAPHLRRRVWIFANSDCHCKPSSTFNDEAPIIKTIRTNIWSRQPRGLGISNGDAYRMERIKAIGNAQVPAVAATAWRLLTENL